MSSGQSRRSEVEGEEPEVASPFDALDARLAALKQKMARGLPDRAAELDDAAKRLEAGATEARDELRRLGHKLRGIAGSYGFGHLGELAAGLETLAKSAEASDAEIIARARDLASSARDAGAPSDVVAKLPEAPVAPAPAEPPRRAALPTVAPELEGLVVLAADDDDATRKLLEITLVQLGRMKGTLFERGPALLDELSRRDKVDLVVVDAMMPDMNGLEILSAVVERGLASRVSRFVVLSAATAEELGWTLPPGLHVGWLRKPFRPRELLTALVTVTRDA
jgi:CheY-like chemotaxis protein/HPt (histidine-containing phosphotransfer) domain-containing protein